MAGALVRAARSARNVGAGILIKTRGTAAISRRMSSAIVGILIKPSIGAAATTIRSTDIAATLTLNIRSIRVCCHANDKSLLIPPAFIYHVDNECIFCCESCQDGVAPVWLVIFSFGLKDQARICRRPVPAIVDRLLRPRRSPRPCCPLILPNPTLAHRTTMKR